MLIAGSIRIHDDGASSSSHTMYAAPIRIMATELIQRPTPLLSCPRLNRVTTTNGAAL